MTQRDWARFALALRAKLDGARYLPSEERQEERVEAVAFSAAVIAAVLGEDNPKFKRERFLRECGLEGGR